MNKTNNKARKHNSSKLKELLSEITPLEIQQVKTKMQLASRIEDCMQDKSWSKSQFAEQIGKNPSEITKWLSGTHNFTIDVLTEIAHTLSVEINSLFEKPKVQIIYKNEFLVKSKKLDAPILITTPFEQSLDYLSCFSTSQSNKSNKQFLT